MKPVFVESSVRIWITITDRERISRWGRTHPSHDPFSRQKWVQSWQCRRSVDCIIATNDGPPEEAPISTALSHLTFRSFWPASAPVLRREPPISHQTRAGLGSPLGTLCSPGKSIRQALHGIFTSDSPDLRLIAVGQPRYKAHHGNIETPCCAKVQTATLSEVHLSPTNWTS